MFLSHVLAILLVIIAMVSVAIAYSSLKEGDWRSSPTLTIIFEAIVLMVVCSGAWSLEHPPTEEVTRTIGEVAGVSVVEVEHPGEVIPATTWVHCRFANVGTREVRVEAVREAYRGGDESLWMTAITPGASLETAPRKECPKLKVYSKRGALLGIITRSRA